MEKMCQNNSKYDYKLVGSDDSEGTDEEEDFKFVPKSLKSDFFREKFDNQFDLFRKYFKAIKKNRYILTLISDVVNAIKPCAISKFTRTPSSYDEVLSFPSRFFKMSAGDSDTLADASRKVKFSFSEEKGRHLVAQANIKQGDVLIVEKAAVFANPPNCSCKNFANFRCHHCSKIIFNFVRCGSCDVCLFCDESCLLNSWNQYHRWECNGLQRHFWQNESDRAAHFALRMLSWHLYSEDTFLEENSRDFPIGAVGSNIYANLYNLETHLKEFSVTDLNSILHACARTLVYLIEKTSFFNWFVSCRKVAQAMRLYDVYIYIGGLLIRHSCQMICNALNLHVNNIYSDHGGEKLEFVAPAVFITASLLNHSCAPNSAVIVDNDTVVIKALKGIAESEEITISYLPLQLKVAVTDRVNLFKNRHFKCLCELCTEPKSKFNFLNTYCCVLCGGRSLLNGDITVCIDCDGKFSFDCRARIELAERTENEYEATKNITKKAMALMMYEEVFYKYNIFLFCKMKEMMEILVEEPGRQIESCRKARQAIIILEKHYSAICVELAYRISSMLEKVVSSKHFSTMIFYEQDRYILKELADKALKAKKIFNFFYPPERALYLTAIEKKFRRLVTE